MELEGFIAICQVPNERRTRNCLPLLLYTLQSLLLPLIIITLFHHPPPSFCPLLSPPHPLVIKLYILHGRIPVSSLLHCIPRCPHHPISPPPLPPPPPLPYFHLLLLSSLR